MRQQRKRVTDEFEDAFDSTGQLKPGVTRIKVPMKMMDSAGGLPTKTVNEAGWARTTRDGTKRDDTQRQSLYDRYDDDITSAWQNPPTGVGSHGFVGCQVGDLCTVRGGGGAYGVEGSPGHLRSINGTLTCVA